MTTRHPSRAATLTISGAGTARPTMTTLSTDSNMPVLPYGNTPRRPRLVSPQPTGEGRQGRLAEADGSCYQEPPRLSRFMGSGDVPNSARRSGTRQTQFTLCSWAFTYGSSVTPASLDTAVSAAYREMA